MEENHYGTEQMNSSNDQWHTPFIPLLQIEEEEEYNENPSVPITTALPSKVRPPIMGTQAFGTAFHRLKGNRITTIVTNEGSQQSKYVGHLM